MEEFLRLFVLAFVPLFVAVDPPGLLPLYVGLTEGVKPEDRRRILIESILTALAVTIGFVVFGRYILDFLGVTTPDFQIAGGILLFVISMLDILTSLKPSRRISGSIGAVPLGIPLIAGPAVLTTSLILASQHFWPTLLALVANILLVGFVLAGANLLSRLLGNAGSKAVSMVASLILAAFAVMMVRQGVIAIIQSLRCP
jgi:multiple antibiotic resistance protein